MERREVLDADELVEFLERRSVSVFRAEIVAGSERVLGVEADSEPVAFFRRADDVADLLEAIAAAVSLSGGDLERDFGLEAATGFMDLVERAGDRLEPLKLTRAHVCARVGDQRRNAQ